MRAPALAALLAAWIGASACGPQPVEARANFSFGEALARQSLEQQMPAALLAQLGGALPDPWPAGAPRLVLDLQVLSRVKLDLKGAGLSTSGFQALRLRALRATSAVAAGDAPLPRPTELLLFAGPLGAASLSEPGVRRLARGAWPMELSDAAAPSDAGVREATYSLVLEPAARADLAALLLSAGQAELLLVQRVPVDTLADPRAPRGSSSVSVLLELELAP